MVNHQDLFGLVAAIVSFMAYPIYIVEFIGGPTKTHWATRWIWQVFRLKGGTSPHQISWLLWAALQVTILISQIKQGSTSTVILPLFYLVGSTITAIFCIKHGERSWTKLDVGCSILAAISMGLLFIFSQPLAALALAILADGIAAIPTMIGVTKRPRDESPVGWSIFFVGALINIGAVKHWNFVDSGYTVYLILVIGYIFLWATFGRLWKKA